MQRDGIPVADVLAELEAQERALFAPTRQLPGDQTELAAPVPEREASDADLLQRSGEAPPTMTRRKRSLSEE